MKAKYPGICTATGRHYPAGTEIEKGPHGWQIAGAKPQDRTLQPGEFRVARGEGYGGAPYLEGQVFHDPKHGYLFVRVAWSEYYSEDGLSFGVGDDSGYIYLANCRPATPAEYLPVWEAEVRATKERWRQDEVKAEFERQFAIKDGEYVPSDSQLVLDGERIKIGQGFTIYGTGEEMVIDADGQHIWRLYNNGMDGDDWSRNNVRTGGAGAIGYRFDATPERLAVLSAIRN